ncbi:lipopolysaccharide kinase InaA family protein [Entomomonas asaccharolytica]|nr:lipopolysaccharide kinase InaA family protein [Entomomonas asaccharolytica]
MTIPPFDSTGKNFAYWWNIQGEWVEEPNVRRGGESGVLRTTDANGHTLYIKHQEGHIYRSICHPLGQATILREYKAYCAFAKAQVKTPKVIYCGSLDKKAILVTESLDGFIDLDSWLTLCRQQNTSAEIIYKVLEATAKMLARMHHNRLQHNCTYAKHIFVKVSEQANLPVAEVALLDLEKSRRRLTTKAAALHDIPQIKRHSLLNAEEWRYFVNCYEKAFGCSLPQLY